MSQAETTGRALALRQIHLDFHTSPHIPDVGRDFDADTFARVLTEAGVDAINLFSKCHHGYSYYTGGEAGRPHPHLCRDLFGEQVAACKGAGISPVAYVSAGWDQLATDEHPEWRRLSPQGCVLNVNGIEEEGAWREVCFNTGYLDYLCAQIEEVGRLYPDIDGYWIDILRQTPCACPRCRADIRARGEDVADPAAQRAQAVRVRQLYLERTTAAAKKAGDVSVFHNMGHVPRGDRSLFPYFDHLEIESLPTGGWGYDHFPVSAAYVQTLGKRYLGMTGRFHTMWGEFGGLKHRNALRYEAMQMLAFGAAVSVGDHLHPTGAIDEGVYRTIGAAFEETGRIAAFHDDVSAVADIAIYSAGAQHMPGEAEEGARDVPADSGAVRVLLESHHLFAVVDDETDLAPYKLVIFPDTIVFDDALTAKVRAYLDAGGKAVFSGDSGLTPDGQEALSLGGTRGPRSPYQPDFVDLAEGFAAEGFDTRLVRYGRSRRITLTDGQSMGAVHDPYFERTGERYCGHLHAPARPEPSGYEAGVVTENTALFAHDVFTSYVETGAVSLRLQIERVLDRLLGDARTLRPRGLPSYGRATVRRQAARGRDVIHLLCAPLSMRGSFWGDPIQVVEDLPPLSGVSVAFTADRAVASLRLEPQGEDLAFTEEGGVVRADVPPFEGRQLVVATYED